MKKIIGVDFDNTIVCYHEVFHEVALEWALIPQDFPANKEKIRDYLRARELEDRWTEMQGYVYGQRMAHAKVFPGVKAFFETALKKKLPLYIVSHKTKHPYAGPKYDLHQAAREWLELNHFFGLKEDQAFFLETKQGKCEKISDLKCTHFIDDLPELLMDPAFPHSVEKLLFTPDAQAQAEKDAPIKKFVSWQELQQHLL